MKKKVSVIMSTYNEPVEWIMQSVQSIQNQTYKNIELIIVIDNPRNFEAVKYLENDESIILIKNEKNIGLVSSLNKALKYVTGEYIARMDADDIANKERIEKQVQFLEKKHLDLCGANIEYFNEKGIIGRSKICEKPNSIRKIMKYEGGVPHPTWLGKTEVFKSLNGYRNIDACEDYDFLVRASLKGYKIGNIDTILLKYRDNVNSISHMNETKQLKMAYEISKYYRKNKAVDIIDYGHCWGKGETIFDIIKIKVYLLKRHIYTRLIYRKERMEKYIYK